MSDNYILNESGEPILCEDLIKWAQWFENSGAERRLAHDELDSGCISTMFLGLDHQYGDGPPLIFETMVFGGELDGEQDRYSTRSDALLGHALMVDRVKASNE